MIQEVTEKPIIVYPNRGGIRRGTENLEGDTPDHSWLALAATWGDLSASVIGGCCRVSPAEISSIRTCLAGPNLP